MMKTQMTATYTRSIIRNRADRADTYDALGMPDFADAIRNEIADEQQEIDNEARELTALIGRGIEVLA